MKKTDIIIRILLCVLLPLACVCAANGQERTGDITLADGRVPVGNLAVSRSGDNLFVSMDLDVSSLSLKTNRELLLTPVLGCGADSLSLPSVMIAGRNRYWHHVRNGLDSETTSLYRIGKSDVIEYRTVVPYEGWMCNADFSAVSELRGCCSESMGGVSEPLMSLGLEPERFVPVFVYLRPAGESVKVRVESGTAYIDYPVSRTDIDPGYRNNRFELEKILSTIDVVRNDSDTRIMSVRIKGYASPESPYENNERLAKGRTETLKSYVLGQYGFADSLITTSYEAEDWSGLERYVEGSSLGGRDGILEIIRSGLEPDAREWKLKKTYPEAYAYLLRNVYPSLRHSDYAVEYEVRAYTDIEEIRRLLKTRPQNLSLGEMYLAAGSMEVGSSEYNEVFEIAVRMFPEDEAANLNAANTSMSLGDLDRAAGYLSKAGDSAEAVYARGIYAALSEDYDLAGRLFAEASGLGIEEADAAAARIAELKK